MKIPIFFVAAACALCCFASQGAKPNIVLINADDLGWAEVGCYGQKKIKTPHIDKLAAQGQKWTYFYSGAPVCSPSRNVLMTGRHTGVNDVQDLKRVDPGESWDDLRAGDWPIAKDAYTLPEALKKAGYATAIFGKWGIGEFGTTGAPDKHGVDRFYGYTDQKACHSYYPPFIWDDGEKVALNKKNPPATIGHIFGPLPKGKINADDYRGEIHSSDLIADKMLEFVKARSDHKQPFFLYYAPLEPHVPLQPTQKWIDEYPTKWDPTPFRGGTGYLPHPRPKAAYAAMISQMDHNVGRLLDTLKACGLENNTIVIFTSDNGTTHDVGGVDHKFFNSVAGLRGLKGQLYEGGIRVPGIIKWPGKVTPGTIIDQPAYHADIMPTLCAIVGAKPGKPLGTDLTPVILGKKKSLPNRNPMVWAGGGYGGQVAVRLGDMKVVRRNLFPKKKPDNWEVYDISKDPFEKNNLAAQHRDLIDKAIAILDREYRPSPGFPSLQYKAKES